MPAPEYHILVTQHRGLKPRSQQDALWAGNTLWQADDLAVTTSTVCADSLLVAVADGVSSSPRPRAASRAVVEALVRVHESGQAQANGWLNGRHVRDVQMKLSELAGADNRGSATTLVAAQFRRSTDQEVRVRILHVGDSRAWRVAEDGSLMQLTRDHSILQHLIDEGEARAGVEYADLYRGLMHCLVAGADPDDFKVDVTDITLENGAAILLTSDGVHDVLGEVMATVFLEHADAKERVAHLRKCVLARGAPDNFSVVLVAPLG